MKGCRRWCLWLGKAAVLQETRAMATTERRRQKDALAVKPTVQEWLPETRFISRCISRLHVKRCSPSWRILAGSVAQRVLRATSAGSYRGSRGEPKATGQTSWVLGEPPLLSDRGKGFHGALLSRRLWGSAARASCRPAQTSAATWRRDALWFRKRRTIPLVGLSLRIGYFEKHCFPAFVRGEYANEAAASYTSYTHIIRSTTHFRAVIPNHHPPPPTVPKLWFLA